MHARILDGSSRHAGWKGKKSFKKIVQICALLCIEINALEEGVLAHFYSFDAGWARCKGWTYQPFDNQLSATSLLLVIAGIPMPLFTCIHATGS
ncbi:hypothetical protein MLI12_18490, partial [Escherichia coli]|nr:hypothetical protein [Escherichia coli]